MKKSLKRLYYSWLFRMTRSDVCPKHWVIMSMHREYVPIDHMGVATPSITWECAECQKQAEAEREEAESRSIQQRANFVDALVALRKEYL